MAGPGFELRQPGSTLLYHVHHALLPLASSSKLPWVASAIASKRQGSRPAIQASPSPHSDLPGIRSFMLTS